MLTAGDFFILNSRPGFDNKQRFFFMRAGREVLPDGLGDEGHEGLAAGNAKLAEKLVDGGHGKNDE